MTHRSGTRVACLLAAIVVGTSSLTAQTIAVPPRDSIGELGLRWESRIRLGKAAQVTGIVPCSPAHTAGLLPGDVIIHSNGHPTAEGTPFDSAIPGTTYVLDIRRANDLLLTLTLVVGETPRAPRLPLVSENLGSPEDFGCQ